MTRALPSLETVLAYRNEDVVQRFAEDHGLEPTEAEEIFLELKRWLWVSAKRKLELERGEGEDFLIPLFNEAYAIDLCWHTFLLFTEDYAGFCERHFGFFLHHYPRPWRERLAWKKRIEEDTEAAWAERKASLRKAYEYLYDALGPEVLVKWCEEFPARFRFS